MLIGGGAVGDQAIRAFADVLPVTVGPLRRDAPVGELERLADLSGISNFVPSLTANTVTLRPNAQALTNDGLISQTTLGAGKIIFAAFDLAALRAWPGESNLWARVLDLQLRIELDIGAQFRFGFNDLLQNSLNTSLFPLPSTMALLALIGVYIIVIGPINFLALRRLRRLEWAWVTTPLLIVIFLAAAYGMSFCAARHANPSAAIGDRAKRSHRRRGDNNDVCRYLCAATAELYPDLCRLGPRHAVTDRRTPCDRT